MSLSATSSEPRLQAALRSASAALQDGRRRVALLQLRALERSASEDAVALQQVAEFYTQCGRHADAGRLYRRAVVLQPGNPRFLYNLASAQIALGEVAEAEALLTEVLRLDPHDYDAHYNRATLRRQTPTRNHIAALERLLGGQVRQPAGEIALCYALAKELEDLGDYPRSFEFLQRGATARRRRLSYQVDADVTTMRSIAAAFDGHVTSQVGVGSPGAGPIFVLGLPRSGTTLVDRIISSHSQVTSLGEINDFAMTMIRQLKGVTDKGELIRRSATMDFFALGEAYRSSVAEHEAATPYVIDKTPLNFLYLGLICLALPDARIVHVRRHPLDSCYAMYKTLFRMGYPFSYDLDDLGSYYLAYQALMAHWRATFPSRILDVDYETLVRDTENETRRLLEYCGLAWEPACLQFHLSTAPAATASAVQVRQPIYRSSVDSWRRYAVQLAPLEAQLRAGGAALA